MCVCVFGNGWILYIVVWKSYCVDNTQIYIFWKARRQIEWAMIRVVSINQVRCLVDVTDLNVSTTNESIWRPCKMVVPKSWRKTIVSCLQRNDLNWLKRHTKTNHSTSLCCTSKIAGVWFFEEIDLKFANSLAFFENLHKHYTSIQIH